MRHSAWLPALALAGLCALAAVQRAAPATAPNELLGTCLDKAWVKKVEADLGISSTELDARGRHVHPYLRPALPTVRFKINDPRTQKDLSKLYQGDCMPSTSKFYGAGARVDATGKITDRGTANGTLVVELKGWASVLLTTMVFSIIAQEVLGYQVSFYKTLETLSMAERMSSVGAGACTPVHMNTEMWAQPSAVDHFAIYSNESFSSGSVGYMGRSGLFTTKAFVAQGLDTSKYNPRFSADFWREYKLSENLLASLPVSALKANSKFYPPTEVTCADDSFGCRDSCSKTEACTQREAQGKECMVVAMMYDYYDVGYLQPVFANLGIAAYFCFLGYSGLQDYVADAMAKNKPVVFYHFEPDPFHFQYEGLFERIALPRSTPEEAQLNTATFGEHGYGGKTDNPVKVDFPPTSLEKYSASLVHEYPLIGSLISRMSFAELQFNKLMREYVSVTSAASPPADPVFATACSWVKSNYATWRLWLDRLPLCSVYTHAAYDFVGCGTQDAGVFPRKVIYRWLMPHPENSSLPYNCDGGLTELPQPLVTSRSCDWLKNNMLIWIFWSASNKPVCDASFYDYNVSACDRAGSKREVVYYWMLADASDSSLSAECAHGKVLPMSVLLDCEYVPDDFDGFVVVAVIAAILGSALVAAMAFVFHYRNLPIIKRSQYEFLLVLLAGGVIICASVCVYAGAPTTVLCSIRPMGISFGFTLIFGALVVKSLRVYRVFMSGAMKRVVLSTKTMFKILGVFVAIDIVILAAWNIADPSKPTHAEEETAAIGGDVVERLRCTSTSFIYTALLIFWKAVLLFAGLYLSFLIRKVSSDFQESVWIFASAVVVLFTSLILLPMAYLVDLPATTFYLFFSFLLLASTATVMSLMIVPKILRLHAEATDTSVSTATSAGDTRARSQTGSSNDVNRADKSQTSKSGREPKDGANGLSSIMPSVKKARLSKVQITPVKPFTAES